MSERQNMKTFLPIMAIAMTLATQGAQAQTGMAAFDSVDLDRNGTISREEFAAWRLRQFDAWDQDGIGEIPFETLQNLLGDEGATALLRLYDRDGNGMLRRVDVVRGLSQDPLFNHLDQNGDGQITRQEARGTLDITPRAPTITHAPEPTQPQEIVIDITPREQIDMRFAPATNEPPAPERTRLPFTPSLWPESVWTFPWTDAGRHLPPEWDSQRPAWAVLPSERVHWEGVHPQAQDPRTRMTSPDLPRVMAPPFMTRVTPER